MRDKPGNNSISCYLTTPFSCSYLLDRQASNLVIDPNLDINDILLGGLLEQGFRRSGKHIYRPHCEGCDACVSIKVPTKGFKANRSQRRNWLQNSELRHIATHPGFNDEHFELYRKYLASRHHDSEMGNPIPTDYIGFLTAEGINTVFHEFRFRDKLLAVAVADHVPIGLSAVYTFYDPDYSHLGLGTYAILWLIRHAQETDLPWVYLGYWINDCAKMGYKSKFNPQLGFRNDRWREMGIKTC